MVRCSGFVNLPEIFGGRQEGNRSEYCVSDTEILFEDFQLTSNTNELCFR